MSRSVQNTLVHRSKASWVWCWGQFTIFSRNCMICPELHIKLIFGHTSHETRGRSWGANSLKLFIMGIQWNVQKYPEVMFSIPPSPQGIGVQFAKECFAWNYINAKTLHKFNVWWPLLHGEGHWIISLKPIFLWKMHELYRLHENNVSWFPTPPLRFEGWTAMHKIKQYQAHKCKWTVPNYSLFWRLTSMRFHADLGHFAQFLAKMISLQIGSPPFSPY